MSRSTQYIGLTRSAMNFLADYQKVKDGTNCTYGMYDDKVPLGEWVSSNTDTKFAYLREVLQDSPWSSGPMLFTCLFGYFHNDPKHEQPTQIFQWVIDPRCESEFNFEKGTYWV